MRVLGYSPTRRLPLRSQGKLSRSPHPSQEASTRKLTITLDMARADLHPAATIFLPLPTSSTHHLITKVTALGIVFEVLQLIRVQADNGAGVKLGVGERVGVDLGMIRSRRGGRPGGIRRRREAAGDMEGMDMGIGNGFGGGLTEPGAVSASGSGSGTGSAFILGNDDLRDIFIYSK